MRSLGFFYCKSQRVFAEGVAKEEEFGGWGSTTCNHGKYSKIIIIMKRRITFTLMTIVGIVFYSSCNNRISNENLYDIEKINKGMHFNQVKLIMRNAPFKQEKYDFEPDEFVSLYQSPIGSSGHFSITYSKNDSIVKRIYRGD